MYADRMQTQTSMRVSTSTRDRTRDLGNGDATLDDTLNEALDALEERRFWEQAEKWHAALTDAEKARIAAENDLLDDLFSGMA